MPTSVPEDFADTTGPNASLEFGQAGDINALQQHFTPDAAALQQQLQQPGRPPSQLTPAGGVPGSGLSSGPTAVQPPPTQGRMNMQQVFPPMPQLGGPQPPWREQLRAFAAHPKAGPYLRMLAARIADQRPKQ